MEEVIHGAPWSLSCTSATCMLAAMFGVTQLLVAESNNGFTSDSILSSYEPDAISCSSA